MSQLAAQPTTFLFAPGAGAAASSPWMQEFGQRLQRLGRVQCFDYPYRLAGKRAPDRLPVLVAAHRAAFEALGVQERVVLIGKSMGSRVGCHLSLELERPPALVCLGYPLVGQSGKLRNEVLLALRAPILFVQGTRDALCPLERLEQVRSEMQAPNELYVVEGGDHSLELTRTELTRRSLTQTAIFEQVVERIERFLGGVHHSLG